MTKFGIALSLLMNSILQTPSTLTEQVIECLPIPAGIEYSIEKSYTQDDLDFLAQNLYFEERSSKATDLEIAQIGYVVLNRVKSKHWPNTIERVIWYKAWSKRYNKNIPHFSWTLDGKSDVMHNRKAEKRSFRIAKAVLEGTIPNMVGTADHYLNKNKSKATWWKTMTFEGRFGNHWFYTR